MSNLLPFEKKSGFFSGLVDGLTAFFVPSMYTANKQRETQRMVVESNLAMEASRQEMRVKEIEAQYLMSMQREKDTATRDELNREFQRQLTTVNHQHQYKLEEFRAEVSVQLQRHNHDFQRWTIEKQRELQYELQSLNGQLQRELRQLDRAAELNRLEEQKKLNNSPLWLVASQILTSNVGQKVPLRVLFSPPEASNARVMVGNKPYHQFPESTEYITEAMRRTVETMKAGGRHIDLIDGAWQQKSQKGAAAAASVFEMLRSEPTLIIESSLEGEYLFIRLAYWGSGWENYRYRTIFSISWPETLNDLAKNRAEEWCQHLVSWKVAGKPTSEFEKFYSAQTSDAMFANHELSIREAAARNAGVPVESEDFVYRWLKSDFNDLVEMVSALHCVTLGLLADEYFLIDVSAQERADPLLPAQLPGMLRKLPRLLAGELMAMAAVSYETLYNHLEQRDHLWRPAIKLDLAQCLLPLPDKRHARAALAASVEGWLVQFGMPSRVDEGFTLLLSRMAVAVRPADRPYVMRLVGIAQQLSEEQLGNAHAEWLALLEKTAEPAVEEPEPLLLVPEKIARSQSTATVGLGNLPPEKVLAWLPVMYRNFWGTVDAPMLAGLLGIPVQAPPSPAAEPGEAEVERTRNELRALRPQDRVAFRGWRLAYLPAALQPRPALANLWENPA